MKKTMTIAAGLLLSSYASAALVTGMDSLSGAPTAFDSAINELYSHISAPGNNYLLPDANANRQAAASTLGQFAVSGTDSIELFALGSNAGNTHKLGIRVMFGADVYRLTLNPDNDSGSETMHYFTSVNSILSGLGGPALLDTEFALVDFFTYQTNAPTNYVFSSGIGNTVADPTPPVFDFTPDLLNNPGPTNAAPLAAGATDAIAFLNSGWEVWGFEDRTDVLNGPTKFEPDYNDQIFAFRIVPVPEPSTYGVIGAIALIGLIAQRRFKMKKA